MRRLVILLVLALAGCIDDGAAPAPQGPATHATDCAKATNATTCQGPTTRTPLAVGTQALGNRSRVGFVLANVGNETLVFDAEPPAFWVYGRHASQAWMPVAFSPGGSAQGRLLEPGTNVSFVLHYGKYPDSRARDVRYEAPSETFDWPSGTYRACWSAHPGPSPEWVRGCKDFRIR